MKLYRIHWESTLTGATGASTPMPKDLAEFRARCEAALNPGLRYWIEPA